MSDYRDNIGGFRDVPGLKMTRRAKEEQLNYLEAEYKKLDELRGTVLDFTEPLDETEKILIAWYHGWITGMDDGKRHTFWEIEFRKKHNISDNEPMPSIKEMLKLEFPEREAQREKIRQERDKTPT